MKFVKSCLIVSGYASNLAQSGTRQMNLLFLALSHLEVGHEVKCDPSGWPIEKDDQEIKIEEGYQSLFHGCNPYPDALHSIPQDGFKKSKDKEDYVAVYASEYLHTAVNYPMELSWKAGKIYQHDHAPAIRVVLEVVGSNRFKGTKNKTIGKITKLASEEIMTCHDIN